MTRDEAIADFGAKIWPNTTCGADLAERYIDWFAKNGMLKLDEPKCARATARDVITREVDEWNMIRNGSVQSDDVAGSLLRAFDRAGLKLSAK